MVGLDYGLCAVQPSKHRSRCSPQGQQYTYCRKEMNDESGGSIASEVYLRLPREIRNRVYLYCVQGSYDNEVIVRRAAGSKDKCTFLVRHPTGEKSYHWAEDPVISMIDAQHLGTEVAREMLETYYWTRIFKFSHYESLLLISFLTTDTFGLDMFPADYARHLHLRIHPQNYAYGSREMKALEIEKCLLAFKALAAVRSPCTEIVVNMDLASCSCDDIDGEDILADLLPGMEQMTKSLNDRSLRTKIAYSRDWDQ